MADFMKYLEERNEKAFFKAQIAELSDFIKDIDIFTHIEVGADELDSLKTYLEECEKRLQCLNEYVNKYESYLEERKGEHDNNKTESQTTEGT